MKIKIPSFHIEKNGANQLRHMKVKQRTLRMCSSQLESVKNKLRWFEA